MSDDKNRTNYSVEGTAGEDIPAVDTHTGGGSGRKSRRKPELDAGAVRITVGQLIAIKRRELRMSQEKLAEKIGMSRTQIGRIERDESEPSVNTIESLESVLGIELYGRFMAQRREKAKAIQKRGRPPGSTIARFTTELSQKDISEEDLKDILETALESAECRSKKKKQ